jgi:twitching motility protein PilI
MSSAADDARWTPSGLWIIRQGADPAGSQPGATALPESALSSQKRRGIAGQISEHLAYHANHRSSASGSRLEETSPPAPAGAPTSAQVQRSLSASAPDALTSPDDEEPATPSEGTAYLTFTLGSMHWGLPLAYLREVLPDAPTITPLPFSPLWLQGLINLRGDPVGLVNLSNLLLDPVLAASVAARIVNGAPVMVAESDGVSLALQVQELGEVVSLPESAFQHLPAAETRALPAFALSHLQAVWNPTPADPPVLLLDLPRLIASLLERLNAAEAPGDG